VFGLFPDDKYRGAATRILRHVLWAEPGKPARYDFLRRLVFSVLIGNADMHLKNWSLLYPDRRTPVLSPAYDFVATLPYIPNGHPRAEFRRQPQSQLKSREIRCAALRILRACPLALYGRW